ncbi:MAG: hypothetical protein K0Q66_1389 [Chitinophagaceae bacterium]|nr:hypothetical protein [Chitinophagaceae bacterium]
MKKQFFSAVVMMMPFLGAAQGAVTDSVKTDSVVKKNIFSGSINYQSALHYFGRVDSMKSSGVFPVLGYEFKNGIYAQGTAVFVQNATTPLTYMGASVEAGYKFPEKKHFEGNVFVSKFIYQDQSLLVQSALQAQTGVNLTYKNKYVNVNGGADLKFSDQTDIGVTAGIDHLFVKKINKWKKSAIAAMPSATVYAGTQQFSNTHIQKENVLGIPVTQQRTEEVKQFTILAYEFSAPVVLVVGKLNAYVIPSFVIPQNLIVIKDRPDLSERGGNLFYVTVGMGFRL